MPITYADYVALMDRPEDERVIDAETSGGSVQLRLVSETPNEGHPGGSLIFTGDPALPLGQDSYPVHLGDADDLLFLVPIAETPDARTYQAVFA